MRISWMRWVCVVVVVLVMALPLVGFAEDASVGLSKRLYCHAYQLISGPVGLFIGFLLALYGLFLMIKGRPGYGFFMIIAGTLVTTLPPLIEASFRGLSSVLVTSGIGKTFFVVDIDERLNGDCDSIHVDMSAYQQQQQYPGYPQQAYQYTPTGELVPVGSGPYFQGAPVNGCEGMTKCPRGIRNNNPGNLRALPGVVYNGQIGVDEKGFAVFSSMDYGVQQLDKQLGIYSSKYGVNTIAGQINRYAPPSENQTNAYVDSVVNYMRKNGYDVNGNTAVNLSDEGFKQTYTRAIMLHENGMEVKR